jgi:hypothetical protein
MQHITINLPEITDVTFTIECLPEDSQVRGNAIDSGNSDFDKSVEDKILYELENGNDWYWCVAKVTAEWRGIKGDTYLGGCSYESEEQFKQDLYYENMRREAYNELINNLKSLAE